MIIKKRNASILGLALSALVLMNSVDLLAKNALPAACAWPNNLEMVTLIKRELLLERENELASALELAKKIYEIDPENECNANTVAGLYGKLEKFDQELLWANRAISINPNYVNAYINLGNAQESKGNSTDARHSFERARQLDPTNPIPIYSIGVILENEGKFKEAAKLYQASIELDPKFEAGYFNLAAMKANLHQFSEARVLLRQLLRLNPNADDAKVMIKRLP